VNGIIDREHLNELVPLHPTPVMFISTVLTQMCGDSAGCEGAALFVTAALVSLFISGKCSLYASQKSTEQTAYATVE